LRTTVVFALLAAAMAAKIRYDGYQLIQVGPFKSQREVDTITHLSNFFVRDRQVIFWSDPQGLRAFEVVVAPDLVQTFLRYLRNIHHEVINTDLQRWIDAEYELNQQMKKAEKALYGTEGLPMDAPERYLEYSEVQDWVSQLAASNSDKVTTESIGTTYEGRSITLAKLSTGSGRPKIWLDCGIHAREWISPATCIWIMDKLVNQYSTNADARRMLDSYDWYVVPVANPDGYQYTHVGDRLWRKTRRPTNADSSCIGADPNRNWDFQWGVSGVSSDPCSDTWPGDSPFSEVSTRAVADYIRANSNNMVFFITMHSFTQLWLVPWAYDYLYPSDYNELLRVGQATADGIFGVNGREFIVGTPPDILYPAAGSSMDWAKGVANVKYCYAPELRPATTVEGGFIIPAVPNIRESGEEIFAGLAAATNAVSQASQEN